MPRAKKADDLKTLQGSWSIVSLEIDGQPIALEGARMVVDGDNFTAEGMGAEYRGKVRVDAARTPKSFDLEFTVRAGEGEYRTSASTNWTATPGRSAST